MEVNQIIIAMEEAQISKKHFMRFIHLCGYPENHKESKRLEFLIDSISDLKNWFYWFSGDIDHIAETTELFKESQIKQLNLSLTDFLIACEYNLKLGLEALFRVECLPHVVSVLSKKLKSGELSLKYIYELNKIDPWYNQASKFANASWKQ